MPRRYILALVVIGVIFFGAIALLVALINGQSSSVKSPDRVVTQQPTNQSLKDVRSVEFTTYGSVVSNEARRAIRIKVSSSEARLQILQGYNEVVIQEQTSPNIQSSFEALVLALDSAGYFKFDRAVTITEGSVCPTGLRYGYSASYFNNESYRSWSTSCAANTGSFRGNAPLVRTLMQNQFPNYSSFTSGVKLQ